MQAMLPDYTGGKAGLAPWRLDFLLQKTVRLAADISRARIGPGPALVVGAAGRLAGLLVLAALEFKAAVVAARAVGRDFLRAVARLDHAGTAHSRYATVVADARRHAVFQPADGRMRNIVRIVEAP